MINFLKNITFIIVSYKSENIIENCIKSINSISKILIVENSTNKSFKNNLEKKYSNVEVIVAGKNLGYAAANNLAINLVKTKYAFILNPDTSFEEEALKQIYLAIQFLNEDFTLLGPSIVDTNTTLPSKFEEKSIVDKADYLKGFALFVNLRKIDFKPLFDENFFLFLEEIDLCKRVRDLGGKIYAVNKCYIYHDGKKSSGNNLEIDKCRNWHWMWSLFFYNKKHYGNFVAYRVTMVKFFSSLIKFLFGYIFFKKNYSLIHKSRIEGLINAYYNKPSWRRPYE